MKSNKYTLYPVAKPPYKKNLTWVTFYSPENETGIKKEDFIRIISESTDAEIINLEGNNLYKQPDLLVDAIHAIKDSVHTINLSFNGLYKLSEHDWIRLCRALPTHIKTLNLSNNKLKVWHFDTFKYNINQIPHSITDILIYNTDFNYPNEEFQSFIDSQGSRIKTDPMPENYLNLNNGTTFVI